MAQQLHSGHQRANGFPAAATRRSHNGTLNSPYKEKLTIDCDSYSSHTAPRVPPIHSSPLNHVNSNHTFPRTREPIICRHDDVMTRSPCRSREPIICRRDDVMTRSPCRSREPFGGFHSPNDITTREGISGLHSPSDVTQCSTSSPNSQDAIIRVSPNERDVIRVALLGLQGVGKSSIILQFVRKRFRAQYIPTIEDTYQTVLETSAGEHLLRITDTSGCYQLPAMQHRTLVQSDVLLLVFSISDRQSLHYLSHLRHDVAHSRTPAILVGNKLDQVPREVTSGQAMALGVKWGCPYIEVSAKDNVNISELFTGAVRLCTQTNHVSLHCPKRRDRLKTHCSIC